MSDVLINPKKPEFFWGVVLGIDTALDKLWRSKPTFLKIHDTIVPTPESQIQIPTSTVFSQILLPWSSTTGHGMCRGFSWVEQTEDFQSWPQLLPGACQFGR